MLPLFWRSVKLSISVALSSNYVQLTPFMSHVMTHQAGWNCRMRGFRREQLFASTVEAKKLMSLQWIKINDMFQHVSA